MRDELPDLLEHVDQVIKQRMWIQLDDAPSHFSVLVRNYSIVQYNIGGSSVGDQLHGLRDRFI